MNFGLKQILVRSGFHKRLTFFRAAETHHQAIQARKQQQ